jgi:hypothetical protein
MTCVFLWYTCIWTYPTVMGSSPHVVCSCYECLLSWVASCCVYRFRFFIPSDNTLILWDSIQCINQFIALFQLNYLEILQHSPTCLVERWNMIATFVKYESCTELNEIRISWARVTIRFYSKYENKIRRNLSKGHSPVIIT